MSVTVLSSPSTSLRHIHASGEMADLTRRLDWSATPVGPVEDWPETLLVTVNILLASRQPMFLWWGSDLTQFYNDAYRPSLGADKHPTALGQSGPACWPEIWPVIGPQIDSVLSRGESVWFEDQLIPIIRDGVLTDVYWTYSYSPVRTPDGRICGVLVVCSETTGRMLASRALHAERARLLNVLHQAPVFFALLEGPQHTFTMANPLYTKLVGGRDLLGKPVAEALPEIIPQGYLDMLDNVYATGVPVNLQDARVEFQPAAGNSAETHFVDFTFQPLREADHTISGIMVVGVDITEKKHSEQALLQSEKLAAVGRLASTIAHEINNPLESVTNLVYLTRRSPDVQRAYEYLDLAELELRRMASITRQTLSFNKRIAVYNEINSDDLFTSVTGIYQSRFANTGVTVQRRMRSRHPILCIEGEIRQVLNNLVSNAIDAMPHGGRLLLRSRDVTHPVTAQAGLVLTVADTGTGIRADRLRRIFEPFYTTKGLGGTGLGLWISHDIIKRHHGELRVRSSVAPSCRGTVFTLFLPRTGPQPTASSS
jgi:signal transduction histidine kinase